jgi:GNAT superfamily N-acetyltransferase
MNLRFERLVAGARSRAEGLPPVLSADLARIRERRGEKIAAFDGDSGELLGWVALYPDRTSLGAFNLAGLEVVPAWRWQGVEAALFEAAGTFLKERHASRLRFGTSPLLTATAELYVTHFGTRYRWHEGVRTPHGQPWPYVSCECDFSDPIARPSDMDEQESTARSVLDWQGLTPVAREHLVWSRPLTVLLPELSAETLTVAAVRDPEFLPTLYGVFQALSAHGYGFAWFDRLSTGGVADGPRFSYLMHRVTGI